MCVHTQQLLQSGTALLCRAYLHLLASLGGPSFLQRLGNALILLGRAFIPTLLRLKAQRIRNMAT